ncbi:MAG: HAD-IA family hydrolase [Gemmatimonadetes bacterium]|nr:HAD-IA family hydrolase [Gemmatimonadota bacterium]
MSPVSHLSTLLFDLDGTLVDSVELILASWRHTMEAHFGEAPEDHVWLETMGQPLRSQFRAFADLANPVEALVATYVEHNHREHDRLIRPFPRVRETLASLRSQGLTMGIVTSKASRGTALALAACRLDPEWFDVVITSDAPVPHKPDPAPVRLALEGVGASPEDAAFIGDSVWDLRAGRDAGVTTVAALWGPFERGFLEREEPDHALEDIGDLVG